MPKDEWFRRKTWTLEDRADFFARLRRSRDDFNKAQYARIQAYELQRVGTPETLSGALQLLDTILSEWHPNAQLAAIHHQYAQCLVLLDQQERAAESFREAFKAQRQHRGEITGAHLDFGELVITVPIPSLYPEVLATLDEFQFAPVFPIQVHRDATIRAHIHRYFGAHDLRGR